MAKSNKMKTSPFTKALWKLQCFNDGTTKSGILDYATVMSCNIVENLNVPLIATDGENIFVNMDWWQKSDIETQVFALSHEAEHIRLLHLLRRGNRNFERWGIACDIYVNEKKLQEGHKVARKYIMGSDYGIIVSKTTTVESIYDQLHNFQKSPGHGKKKEFAGYDLIEPQSVVSQEKAAERIKMIISAASSLGYDLSKSPELEVLYEDVSVSRRDWKKETANFVASLRRCKWDRTTAIPAYRARRIIVPYIKYEKRMKLGIVIDTSGSIFSEANTFLGYMKTVVSDLDPEEVTLMFADENVTKETTFKQIPENIKATGGGGTRFWPALQRMKKIKDLGGVIYFTDGYGEYGKKPAFPVLWVMTTNYLPPYGDVCKL